MTGDDIDHLFFCGNGYAEKFRRKFGCRTLGMHHCTAAGAGRAGCVHDHIRAAFFGNNGYQSIRIFLLFFHLIHLICFCGSSTSLFGNFRLSLCKIHKTCVSGNTADRDGNGNSRAGQIDTHSVDKALQELTCAVRGHERRKHDLFVSLKAEIVKHTFAGRTEAQRRKDSVYAVLFIVIQIGFFKFAPKNID